MKTIELSGIIKYSWEDDFEKIFLVQEDGYKIDLVGRFCEIKNSFPKSSIQVGYYLSNTSKKRDEMVEGFLKTLYGGLSADYERNDYAYSSWTQGTDFNTYLSIGGHSLFYELKEQEGRFVFIEINLN